MNKNNNYNPLAYLNVFKFIGAFVIAIIFHSLISITNKDLHVYTFLKSYGRFFVEMFFIISGMLFYYVYYPKLRKGDYTKTFFLKRVIAFYPIIIFVNLYAFFLFLIVFKTQGETFGSLNALDLVLCLLFGDLSAINGPYLVESLWYINVLMVVGVLTVGLVLLQKKKEKKWIYLIPMILGVVMIILHKHNYSFVFWKSYLPRGLITFNIGIYLMMFLKRFDVYSAEKKMYIRIISAGIFVVSCVLLISNVILTELTKYDYDMTLYFAFVVFPPLFILCYDVKWLNSIFSENIFTYLGSISLGMYVLRAITHKTIKASKPIYNWCKSIGGWSILIDAITLIFVSILFTYLYKKLKNKLENIILDK